VARENRAERTKMDTEVAAHIATIVAAITGITVLGFTAVQLRLNAQAQKQDAKARTEEANARIANFWLELRKMFADHNEVHVNLTPRGAWADSGGTIEKEGDTYVIKWARNNSITSKEEWEKLKGPTGQEWRKVEAYMGFFEHCAPMLRNNLIDLQTFKDVYRYRLVNIMANRKIVMEKLGRRREGWKLFMELLSMVEIEVPSQESLQFR
jgi:hypothetical protein